MRSKMLGLLVVVALLLTTFGTAFAQEMPEPFCGDLDEADCALITNAQETMMGVSSYKAAGQYSAMIKGIPGLAAEEVAVDVMVDGAFAMDDAALAAAQVLGAAQTQEDIAQVLAESPETILDFLGGWDADLVLTVAMNDDLAAALSTEAGVEIPAELAIGLLLVDGVLYADLTEVAPLAPGTPEGWIGIPLAEYLAAAAEQGGFEMAAAQMSPDAMAASGMDPASMAVMGAVQGMVGNPESLEQFMSIERGEDAEVDGEVAAVFNSSFDLLGFVTSEEFTNLVTAMADAGAFGEDSAAVTENLGMLGMVAPMVFQGLSITGSATIGTETNYVYNDNTAFVWDMAGLMQMAAMSGALPADMAGGDAMISVTSDVTNSDIGAEQSFEAPADAMMIPLEAMMAQ